MNRIRLALIFSVGVHAGLMGVQSRSLAQHPDLSIALGESRLAMVFVEKKAEKTRIRPEKELLLATESEVTVVREAEEEMNLIASTPSDGVVWAEPRYLVNTPPAYPRRALLRNIQGKVVLVVDIDVEGEPSRVHIEKSSGSISLDQAAVKAVKSWIFQPAMIDEEPAPSRSRVPIQFVIKP